MSEDRIEPEKPAEDFTFARTLLQFFVVPAVVVALCVGIFLFFTWAVSEEETALDYVRDIRTGSASRRWQAAFELAKLLNHDPEGARVEGLAPALVDAFEDAEDEDPRVRRYLALALGHLGDPQAVPALLQSLSRQDAETRIYALWALGTIGDRGAIEPVLAQMKEDDPGIRKMAAYSLGALRAHQAQPALVAALNDAEVDVAWNAAIALAKLGDDSGRARLLQMLDRSYLETVETMTDEQRAHTMIAALQAAALIPDPELRARVEQLADEDPNLNVRRVALEALEAMDKAVDGAHLRDS